MANHPHILAVFKDADKAKAFYMEVEKKLTDSIKRLLGVRRLNLWRDSPRVIEIADKASAIKMIAYYYANPAAANLVSTIENYPGLSSWHDFLKNTNLLAAKVTHKRPWIRLPSIQKLPNRGVTEKQDTFLTERLQSDNKETQTLEIFPNAWMKCFGVQSDLEVQQINHAIICKVRHNEDVCRRWRQRQGKNIMGASKLSAQPMMAHHIPRKEGRRIFCIASTKELRIKLVVEFQAFCRECARCFRQWRSGQVLVPWPPGAFLPPIPPRSNAINYS